MSPLRRHRFKIALGFAVVIGLGLRLMLVVRSGWRIDYDEAMIGLLGLSGILVNDSIVLVSRLTERIENGESLEEASIGASCDRLRAVLLTSLTTIAGLSGLALGLGGESLIWGPVATAIVSGLTFSSILTLFAIPLLFRLFVKEPNIS